eukprot:TRINITY_DN8111_c0_g1_i1.p1 TRINITY_DN8111_c0_g1~~TRINITY_DN8111_c0_g1_i1.p1  ORF type:complete len:609 (+),score=146.80 TRINITY_DN8111_c0_g1_i1:55-1881(+)
MATPSESPAPAPFSDGYGSMAPVLPPEIRRALQSRDTLTGLTCATGSELGEEATQPPPPPDSAISAFCTELLPEGSRRGAVFNLASATLGAGALSLPYAFAQSGILLGLVWLAVASLATIFSIKLLLRASRVATARAGFPVDSYEDLTRLVFGKEMLRVVELCIIMFCYGTSIAYCVAVGDILEPIRRLDWMPELLQGDHGRSIVMVSFWAVLMLPLSLLRSVSSLQFSSFLGVAAILVLVSATIYHCVWHRFIEGWDCADMYAGNPGLPEADCSGSIRLAHFDLKMVGSLPLVMFAFTCQVNVYDIYRELKVPSEEVMMQVSWVGMCGLCFSVYALMGVFGYFDFKNAVDGNILNNLQYDAKRDGVIVAAFGAITMTVTVAFPLVIFPTRESLFSIMNAPRTEEEHDDIINQVANPALYPKARAEYVVGPAARPRMSRSYSCLSLASYAAAQHSPTGASVRSSVLDRGAAAHSPTAAKMRTSLKQSASHVSLGSVLPAEAYFVPPEPTRVYKKPGPLRHYTVSFCISSSALLCAIFVPNVKVVFSFLGGVCSSFLCFILPAMLVKNLRANEEEGVGMAGRLGTEALLWGGIVAGVLSTTVTVIDALR